jgi:hypothetical protein
MWEFSLISLLTYHSWPSIDICLIENSFLKYLLNIFIWLLDWGGGPTFVIDLGSVSPLSDPKRGC